MENNPITPPTPPAAPAPVPQAPGTPPQSTTDTLGIISLVMAFFGLSPIGFILGLIGVKKAKEEGRPTTLSKIGWILNLVFMIIAVILITLIVLGLLGTSKVVQEAVKQQAQSQQQAQDQKNDADQDQKTINLKEGETGQLGSFAVKIDKITRNYQPSVESEKATDGKEFIVLDLTVKNTSQQSEYASSYDFAVMENGKTNLSWYVAPPGTKFPAKDVAAGETVSGEILYEVTAGATNLALSFH